MWKTSRKEDGHALLHSPIVDVVLLLAVVLLECDLLERLSPTD